MQRLAFIYEAKACGFNIDERWLQETRHADFLGSDDLHPFDLLLVEALLTREVGRDDFLRELVLFAKRLERSWEEADTSIADAIREEDARRTKVRHSGGRLPSLNKNEKAGWRHLDLHRELPRAWQVLRVSPSKAREMYDDIRSRVRHHDGYWKVRWMFHGNLDSNAIQALSTNATGSMRYAHVLYRMGALIGKYVAWKTGKAAPPLVTAPAGGTDWRQPRSLCPYCGEGNIDWGEQPRKHCGKSECKRKYEKQRKTEQRSRAKERSAQK